MRTVEECEAILKKAKGEDKVINCYYTPLRFVHDHVGVCPAATDVYKHFMSGNPRKNMNDAADYVESLYPKATPEPLTCRCKRMKWWNNMMWFDAIGKRLYTYVVCPDCHTTCDYTGAISYKDGPFGMLSTPYREEDLLESLRNQEATVTLKDAVKVLFNQFPENTHGQFILLWVESKDDKDLLGAVGDAMCENPLNIKHFELGTVVGRPLAGTCETAAMIVRVSGTPEKIELNIQKNRYGSTFNLHAIKETPVTEAIESEPRYLHLRRRDMETGEYMQTGGITLAFIRVGNWYRVGAAFCSLKDVYQKDGVANGKPVGRRLAKARLWTSPCWIPAECWNWHIIPSYLSTKEGRAWYDHAVRKGMIDWWDLAPKHKEEKVAADDDRHSWDGPVVTVGPYTYAFDYCNTEASHRHDSYHPQPPDRASLHQRAEVCRPRQTLRHLPRTHQANPLQTRHRYAQTESRHLPTL